MGMGSMFSELCRWEKLQKPQNSQFLLTTKLLFVLPVRTTYSQDSTDTVSTPAQISFMTDYSLTDRQNWSHYKTNKLLCVYVI
jgi:hypothetical protein